MTIYEALAAVQHKLKAPKGQYNSFGKYKYRSCEDILEAAKPVLSEYGLALVLSDEIKLVGERYYVEATATVYDKDGNYALNRAYAREDENKKGMDGSQITGTASSYARKYALNGLFDIDDTKDADTDEYAKNAQKPAEKEPVEQGSNLCVVCGIPVPPKTADKCRDKYGVCVCGGDCLHKWQEMVASGEMRF